ncbi:MAG: hypothetical protein FWD31_11625, partial [Planctomycetaceae bacterium]|nr:hypothetical protein [Planctomycetaceae bacterium]
MARGESQTLLIWTIIFLIFSLIMIIVTVVLRSKYTEAASLLAEATSKNRQLTDEVGTLKSDGAKLREMIGYPTADMPVADIETAFADHVKLFAPAVQQQGVSYLTVLKDLSGAYANQVGVNEGLNDRNTKLQAELDAFNAAKQELLVNYDGMATKLRNDLTAEQAKHATQLANMMDENLKLKEY